MRVIHHEIGRDPLYRVWHAARSCMIIYFYTEGGSVVLQDRIYPIQKGALCFVRAGQQHYTLSDKPETYDRSKIFLPEQTLEELVALSGEGGLRRPFADATVLWARIPPELRGEVEHLYAEAARALEERGDTAMPTCAFFRLLLLLRDFSSEHVEHTDSRGDSLTRAIDFINRHYAEPISLDDICREVYISKYYLCRRFKRVVGMTVMDYLLKTRIAAAKSALVSDGRTVAQISEACGFSGLSYFSQIFKKHTGMTPLQYRKHIRTYEKE